MAMYFMNGKTFLKEYIKENPRKVLKTQFIIVSSTIRKTGKYEKQVMNYNNFMYPSMDLICDYDDYKNDPEYHQGYMNQLDDCKPTFATLIKYVIENNSTIVFLCSYTEKKYYYLNLIQKYVKEEFGFPIYNYKKIKEGKARIEKYDEDGVVCLCNEILKNAAEEQMNKRMSSDVGRKEIISSMTKDEMKKELKKRDLYVKGMEKSEMRDMLLTFM